MNNKFFFRPFTQLRMKCLPHHFTYEANAFIGNYTVFISL